MIISNLMSQEILEQAGMLHQIADRLPASLAPVVQDVHRNPVRCVIIAARGTSDNAAQFAKYRFETQTGWPVSLAAPSTATLYHSTVDLRHTLAIGISQSGHAQDVLEVLQAARQSGAVTIAVTNDPASPVAQMAAHHLDLCAGPERSVAATKTYTASLAVLHGLVSSLQGEHHSDSLHEAADCVQAVLTHSAAIDAAVERYRYMPACVSLGRGYNYSTALEAALKLIETCYVIAKAYSAADFLHGPIAIVDSGFPCFLFAPSGAAYPSMRTLHQQLCDRHAESLVFTDTPDDFAGATRTLPMPACSDERITPIVYAVAAQRFACALSHTRGLDPDHPRGLSKVTVTR